MSMYTYKSTISLYADTMCPRQGRYAETDAQGGYESFMQDPP